MKLLIVDDMKSFLDLEKSFLCRAECKLLTASTGLEAIKVAQMEKPDLIILDVEMPEMNGIEATRIITSHKELKDIPVVILSSTTRKDEALAAGAREFLNKPLDEDRFLEMVNRYVQLKVRKDERRDLIRPCFFIKDGQSRAGSTLDLSISGIFLKSAEKLDVGDRLTVSFTFPLDGSHKEIHAEGMVVRATERGYGVRFTDISEGARLYIRDYIRAS